MRGISHKELVEIDPWKYDNQQDLLNHIIEQCKQINPWLSLDENTPKDRKLLMFIPGHGKEVMRHSEIKMWSPKPTHYQELPDDPEPGDKNA